MAAGDVTRLLAAMAQMQARLVDVGSHVRQHSDSRATASSQIAHGTLDLSVSRRLAAPRRLIAPLGGRSEAMWG